MLGPGRHDSFKPSFKPPFSGHVSIINSIGPPRKLYPATAPAPAREIAILVLMKIFNALQTAADAAGFSFSAAAAAAAVVAFIFSEYFY